MYLFRSHNSEVDTLEATVREAVESFGSPIFIVSEKELHARYRRFSEALFAIYEPSTVAYSFKTNSLPKVCATLKAAGALAEVVSESEYALAEKLGYRGPDIVYNGPHKTDESLARAISGGSIINSDNWEEIERIHAIARTSGSRARIGLRLNTAANPFLRHWQRFGFNVENGEAEERCRAMLASMSDFIDICGFQVHIGTGIHDVKPYAFAAESIARFVYGPAAQLGIHPEYIDFGGGFVPESYQRRGFETGKSEPLEASLRAIVSPFIALSEVRPRLMLEPGRYLVSDAVILASRVVAAKRLVDGTQQLTVDASITILPDAPYIVHDAHAISPIHPREKSMTIMYGASCTAADNLFVGELPILKRGDIVYLRSSGAYSISRAAQFIYPRPAIAWIDREGSISLARKAETLADITMLDALD